MQFTTFVLAALSLGSAIAAPATPVVGLPAFNVALAAVSDVRSVVDQQIAIITTLVQGQPGADTIAKVKESLLTIGESVNNVLAPIQALNKDSSSPLSKSQIASIPQLVKDTEAILAGIQVVGRTVINGLGQKVNQIQPELQWAISAVAPITGPLISFVTTAVPATSPIIAQVNPILAQIQSIANGLLTPVQGLLEGTLGGILGGIL